MRRILKDKIAMPVPAAKDTPETGWQYPDVHEVFKDLPQEEADQFAKENGPLSFLGSGTSGAVYENDDKSNVIKLTTDRDEAASAHFFQNHPCPCVAQIVSVTAVGWMNWKIVRERATPLTPQQGKAVNALMQAIMNEGLVSADQIPQSQAAQYLKPEEMKLAQSLFTAVKTFVECFRSNGLHYNDMIPSNFGFLSGGRIGIIDLGGLR